MLAGEEVPTGGIPIPTGNGVLPINRRSPPGQAYAFPLTYTTLPAVTPGAGLGPALNGQATDMVTILYADSTLPLNQTPLTAIAADGSSMTVDAGTPITGANGLAPATQVSLRSLSFVDRYR